VIFRVVVRIGCWLLGHEPELHHHIDAYVCKHCGKRYYL
jgi:hypothetical protein